MCSTIAPIFRSLAVDPLYAPYLPHLNRVLLSRQLSQLSQVYSSIRLSYISELIAPLNEPWHLPMTEGTNTVLQEFWDASKLEAFIMGCARRGELLVRIDHADESISFAADLFNSSTPGASTSRSVPLAQLQTPPAELIRTRFSRFATALSTSLVELYPLAKEAPTPHNAFVALVKAADEERHQLAIRRVMTIRRAELLAELSVRKKQEEESRRAEAARKRQEEDSKNALATARRREAERIQREVDAAHKEEAKTLAKTLIAKGGLKINDEVSSFLARLACFELSRPIRTSINTTQANLSACKSNSSTKRNAILANAFGFFTNELTTLNGPIERKRHLSSPRTTSDNKRRIASPTTRM